jgi:hypothetical protein
MDVSALPWIEGAIVQHRGCMKNDTWADVCCLLLTFIKTL